MKIDSTQFGSITIEGETYPHEVVVRLSGKVEKRKKKLSKEIFGMSHVMSRSEAEFVYEKGSDLLVLGTGQYDNVRLSPEAAEFFERKGCEVLAEPTPRAIAAFNLTKGHKYRPVSRHLLMLSCPLGRLGLPVGLRGVRSLHPMRGTCGHRQSDPGTRERPI
jgi:hypothetical protein